MNIKQQENKIVQSLNLCVIRKLKKQKKNHVIKRFEIQAANPDGQLDERWVRIQSCKNLPEYLSVVIEKNKSQ